MMQTDCEGGGGIHYSEYFIQKSAPSVGNSGTLETTRTRPVWPELGKKTHEFWTQVGKRLAGIEESGLFHLGALAGEGEEW